MRVRAPRTAKNTYTSSILQVALHRRCTRGRCSTTSNRRRRLIRDPHDFHKKRLLFHIKRGRRRLIYRVIIHLKRWGENVMAQGSPRHHVSTRGSFAKRGGDGDKGETYL